MDSSYSKIASLLKVIEEERMINADNAKLKEEERRKERKMWKRRVSKMREVYLEVKTVLIGIAGEEISRRKWNESINK